MTKNNKNNPESNTRTGNYQESHESNPLADYGYAQDFA